MKKLMAVFFSGCVLIGLGIGITVVELKEWKVSPFREILMEKPVETCEEELRLDIGDYRNLEINLNGYHSADFYPETEAVYDSRYTNSVKVVLNYRGNLPQVFHGGWWENEDGTKTITSWIDTNNYYDVAQIFEMAEEMFDNKTYYTYCETTRIEKITVYTAYPDRILFV